MRRRTLSVREVHLIEKEIERQSDRREKDLAP